MGSNPVQSCLECFHLLCLALHVHTDMYMQLSWLKYLSRTHAECREFKSHPKQFNIFFSDNENLHCVLFFCTLYSLCMGSNVNLKTVRMYMYNVIKPGGVPDNPCVFPADES